MCVQVGKSLQFPQISLSPSSRHLLLFNFIATQMYSRISPVIEKRKIQIFFSENNIVNISIKVPLGKNLKVGGHNAIFIDIM